MAALPELADKSPRGQSLERMEAEARSAIRHCVAVDRSLRAWIGVWFITYR